MKEEIGNQVETLRKNLGVSTYELEKKGIHPSLPGTIEKGKKGYSIESLIKYLSAINEIYSELGKEKKELVIKVVLERIEEYNGSGI